MNVIFFHSDKSNTCIEGRKEDFYFCEICEQFININNKLGHSALCIPKNKVDENTDVCQICLAKYD